MITRKSRFCQICGKHKATQHHHCFPQTKPNIKIYGYLIDEEFNRRDTCGACNGSHANIPEEFHWDETRFRMEAWKLGYPLPAPSKTLNAKRLFRGEDGV